MWQGLPEAQLCSRALPGQTLPGPAAQVQALQFEWAWQHPDKSKALREAYASIRKADLKGARGKVRPWLRLLTFPAGHTSVLNMFWCCKLQAPRQTPWLCAWSMCDCLTHSARSVRAGKSYVQP